MDESSFRSLIRGETRGPLASGARVGLAVAASGYGIGVAIRNAGFDLGLRRPYRSKLPVVSVGNLTLGGTGKTPMVEWVARGFRQQGLRVAILSRGYGASDGLNDEGRVLEQNLPDVPHLQGKDRVALAKVAEEELESEVLVLDDGFQHRRLARDVDLVLLDALDPFGQNRLFPRGMLREPPRSLRRAGVVILTRADLVSPWAREAIRESAERWVGPLRWAEARHAPRDLVDGGGQSAPLDRLQGSRAAAFCGLGNPEGFRRTLERLNVDLAAFRSFPDHHPYARDDVAELASWAREAQADLVLTTQKDSVKLRTQTLGDLPLWALRIGQEFLSGQAEVELALAAILPPGHGKGWPVP